MKIINKVMVFVMGVVVIGIASTLVGVVTQPKNVEKTVTFDIDLLGNKVTDNTYQQIYELSELSVSNMVINVKKILYNGLSTNEIDDQIRYVNGIFNINFISGDTEYYIDITPANYLGTYQEIVSNDTISITFDVEVEISPFIKTLILLIPLILSASLIGYLAVKVGDEQ